MRGSGEGGPHPLRLFFALWPDKATRAALAAATADAVARVDGQAVPAANYHVTLAFLGSVPGRRFADLVQAAGRDRHPRVDLAFDRLEYWVKARALVATPTLVPAAAFALVDWLWSRIEPLGMVRESRPWHPHLTLVRRVRRRPPEDLSISAAPSSGTLAARWKLALVESITHAEGARYKPLAEWPLG